MRKINFYFQTKSFIISNIKSLKQHIKFIFNTEGKALADLNIIFCSDEFLLNINKQYLHHDEYTDVLTFDLSENKEEVSGEIYISVERVKENASNRKIPFLTELHRVMYHGSLHLCGYSDDNHESKSIIRKKENFYLDLFPKI